MAWGLAAVRGYNPTKRAHKKELTSPPFTDGLQLIGYTIITPFNRLCQSQIRFELIVPVCFFPGFFGSCRFMRTQWIGFLRSTQSRCCSQHSAATKHRLLSRLMLHTFYFIFLFYFFFGTLLGWRMCTGSVWDVSLPFLSHRQKGGRSLGVPSRQLSIHLLEPWTAAATAIFCTGTSEWLTRPPPPNLFSSLFDERIRKLSDQKDMYMFDVTIMSKGLLPYIECAM